ncbi:MAG: CpXC domain-containing protein [Clostridia bacterium]|nr:CpXC domain-containing protein [Clostridia bacterium]
MSKQKVIKFNCNVCNEPVEFISYGSINARQNPELKQKLIDDTLYKITCPKCGAKLKTIYPLLYHDPDKKFMVYGVPPDDLYKIINTFNVMKDKYPNAYEGYTLRVASNPTDFREKVIILNANLDDRVIEIYKALDVNSINALDENAKATRGYFFVDGDKNMIEFDATYYIKKELSADNYDYIKSFFATDIEGALNNYIVDVDWAKEIISIE